MASKRKRGPQDLRRSFSSYLDELEGEEDEGKHEGGRRERKREDLRHTKSEGDKDRLDPVAECMKTDTQKIRAQLARSKSEGDKHVLRRKPQEQVTLIPLNDSSSLALKRKQNETISSPQHSPALPVRKHSKVVKEGLETVNDVVGTEHGGREGMFEGMSILLVESGVGQTRLRVFKEKLPQNGAKVRVHATARGSKAVAAELSGVTHLLTELRGRALLKALCVSSIPDGVVALTPEWFSQCLAAKHRVPCEPFVVPESADGDKLSSSAPARLGGGTGGGQATTKEHVDGHGGTTIPSNQQATSTAPVGRRAMFTDDIIGSSDSEAEGVVGIEGVEGTQRVVERGGGEGGHEDSPIPASMGVDASQLPEHVRSQMNVHPRGTWACAQPSQVDVPSHNKHIIEQLEKMLRKYEVERDVFHVMGYQKAITSLKNASKRIESMEEARALPNVGKKLAEHIWEIIRTGRLEKTRYISKETEIIDMFRNIWGVGPYTARKLYEHGYRTLEDLEKADLNHQQKIGLKHYHDFLEKMPRDEVTEIKAIVMEAAHHINPQLKMEVCGSYRRGKAMCGDVDVLISDPYADGDSQGVAQQMALFKQLLARLRESGFITDDLSVAHDERQQKFMGVCRVPGRPKYRRLDLIVVPWDEYACSLLYFTGSGYFNRSMRLLAKKKGMSLSQHSLNVGVVRARNGDKLNEGTPIHTPTEESVFDALGLQYLPPSQRDA
eukprot:comp18744_c0_seq1/m.20555 comp18744_c0_seq1/g.20555  ORF comp18744_c0_seq1/g.20555 comp18744_c0_seq1/m.20555 type:complete len:723 (-) comp18744_c0_seq1:303-2471(-)